MAVPKYYEFLQPALDCLMSGATLSAPELRAALATRCALSVEDIAEMLPSGKQRLFDNRVHWAITYLKKAGLVEAPKKGAYRITPTGIAAINDTNHHVDLAYLERYKSFKDFVHSSAESTQEQQPPTAVEQDLPVETLEHAFQKINVQLADELLETIMDRSPTFFEHLVVKLLVSLGYGGALDNPGQVVGKSGDEGIDGIIREDKLGFSNIYIQAKRWDREVTVGRPEIQKFVGALVGQGATKGLFITTAKFSDTAYAYANKQAACKVVLVDGQTLAKLMIEYGLGVSEQATYVIHKIDTDFFDE